MKHVIWNFHLAVVFRLHTVVRLKERWPEWKWIAFACSHIYYIIHYSEWKLEHIDISGRKLQEKKKKELKKMETFHSISWGQHIEKQEIFTKAQHNEAILRH